MSEKKKSKQSFLSPFLAQLQKDMQAYLPLKAGLVSQDDCGI